MIHLRAQFCNPPGTLARIQDMEGCQNIVDQIDGYYQVNKGLSQRDYAVKARDEFEGLYFNLAMCKYDGRKVDYRATLRKYHRFLCREEDTDETRWHDFGCCSIAKNGSAFCWILDRKHWSWSSRLDVLKNGSQKSSQPSMTLPMLHPLHDTVRSKVPPECQH